MAAPHSLLTVAVMSYNRPAYLLNCVESVRQHLPSAHLLIIDDASDDPQQQALLRDVAQQERTEVMIGGAGSDWHGGLYGNMQQALMCCKTPLLLFLQDDTQLVRDIPDDDIASLARYFEHSDRAFLYPFFLKLRKRRIWKSRFTADEDNRLLQPKRPGTAPAFWTYSDIVLAHVPALRAAGWSFMGSELANERQAAALFPSGMSIIADPWGFYCPEVPVFRHRERVNSWIYRLTARVSSGANKLNALTPEAVQRLVTRTPITLPIAEDWLAAQNPRVKTPFVFDEMKRSRLVWLAYRLERWVRK